MNNGWPAGPPAGVVSYRLLSDKSLIRGEAAIRATAFSKVAARSPRFEPNPIKQTGIKKKRRRKKEQRFLSPPPKCFRLHSCNSERKLWGGPPNHVLGRRQSIHAVAAPQADCDRFLGYQYSMMAITFASEAKRSSFRRQARTHSAKNLLTRTMCTYTVSNREPERLDCLTPKGR